jgi:hypothetical protein
MTACDGAGEAVDGDDEDSAFGGACKAEDKQERDDW